LRVTLNRRAAALQDSDTGLGQGQNTLSPEARARIEWALMRVSRDQDGPGEPN
jgi:hypothetical protein